MARYIFVTGGVVSSLGKGLSSASLAYLLKSQGFKVRVRKMDPYLNVDPGTMSPFQHGEVFVTDDGAETDLDLGHYERFTGVAAKKTDSISSGKIYSNVLDKERKGDYLGKIAREFNVKIHQIKTWNNLRNTKLNINDKLVLFVPKGLYKEPIIAKEYVIQKGDTLWGIAQKLKGVSVKQLKLLNNLENDKLKPGTKIKIPKA